MKKPIIFILIWACVFFLYKTFWYMYKADTHFIEAQSYLVRNDTEMAIKLTDKAVAENPLEPNYYRGRARIYIVTQEDKNKASEDLRKAYDLNPNNLVTIRNEIPLYYFLALKDGSPDSFDENYFPTAKEFLEINKMRFSHDAGVVALIAKYEKRLGLVKEYEDSVKMVGGLRPDLLEWHEAFR